MKTKEPGNFILSLDFELSWGIIEMPYLEKYKNNIKGVQTVIPRLLALADKYDVHLTFGVVGFLYYDNKDALLCHLPKEKPSYKNTVLSPYRYIENRVLDKETHFSPHLIRIIKNNKNHEIGSHTFCHYYCQEEGQTLSEFKDDVKSAQIAAGNEGIELHSLIFPRNQCNYEYLDYCRESGIICYRGNENNWLHPDKPHNFLLTTIVRLFRFLDTFVNITGYNCYKKSELSTKPVVNIPASRFFRHYTPSLRRLEGLKLKRIKGGMLHAAKNGEIYHLWFHPHNIGINQDENFSQIEEIFKYYKELKDNYNYTSLTMSDLAKDIIYG